MLRNIAVLLVLLLSPGLALPAFSQDDIARTLSRAESLYFEARFNESIQLLSQLNDSLRSQPNRVKERVATKFQLALANIGLNNAAAAKAFLVEIYALDPEFVVDAQQFSPKVITLASEAKAEQTVARCKVASDDARRYLAGGDTAALLSLLQSMKPKCSELATVEPDAAELVFKKGLNEYKQGFLPGAIQSFKSVLSLVPRHELATQYLELSESKLQVAGDRVVLDWQKSFQSRQFKQAGALYRQLASFTDANSAQTLSMMATEYRKALDPLIESFNRVCSSGDTITGSEIRDQISDLLPEASFASDMRSKMVDCTPPPPPPSVVTTPAVAEPRISAVDSKGRAADCFHMEAQLAMHRLKQRIEPMFTPQALAYLQNAQATVMVKVRIEETGSVTVLDATGASTLITSAVRSAVSAWKFTPAKDDKGARCVDTDIPFVISRR
jgi:tetratricopeptide (TPR) repeat protein